MINFKDLTENYYYHGTSPVNAEHILKHGLDPSKSKYSSKLYMTKNYGEASKYAKFSNNGKPGVVLKIHKDHINPEHIHSDTSGIIEYKGKIESNKIEKL